MNKPLRVHDVLENVMSGEWGTEATGKNDVFVIRTTNFTNKGIIDFSKEVVKRNIEQKKVDAKKLIKGDIIIEKSGGSLEQPVGRVIYFGLDEDEETYLCNNFTSVLRPKKEIVDSKYLLYFLFNQYQRKTVLKFQNQTTGIINLKLDNYLKDVEILLPPLEEQKKIAQVLDKAQSLIDKRKEAIAKLDELVQAVFFDMFGDLMTNPKGWEKLKFPDICAGEKNAIKAGPFGSALKKEFYVDKGYKIYGQEQVIKDDFSYGNYYIDEEKYKTLESCKIASGDILISLVGTFGKVSIVPDRFEPGIINPRLMKITLDQNKAHPIFIKYLIGSSDFKVLLEHMSHGGTMGILNVGLVKGLVIPVPPIEVQHKFVRFINQQLDVSCINESSLRNLESNFNALLQQAFKGELSIKDEINA